MFALLLSLEFSYILFSLLELDQKYQMASLYLSDGTTTYFTCPSYLSLVVAAAVSFFFFLKYLQRCNTCYYILPKTASV